MVALKEFGQLLVVRVVREWQERRRRDRVMICIGFGFIINYMTLGTKY